MKKSLITVGRRCPLGKMLYPLLQCLATDRPFNGRVSVRADVHTYPPSASLNLDVESKRYHVKR